MNLFILSLDPAKIAEYMMDKHIAKIILEAVQMLCTTQRLLTAATATECDPYHGVVGPVRSGDGK